MIDALLLRISRKQYEDTIKGKIAASINPTEVPANHPLIKSFEIIASDKPDVPIVRGRVEDRGEKRCCSCHIL